MRLRRGKGGDPWLDQWAADSRIWKAFRRGLNEAQATHGNAANPYRGRRTPRPGLPS